MHNLVSKNQLSGWSVSVDNNSNLEIDKIDDYFDCLIECTDYLIRVEEYAKSCWSNQMNESKKGG